MFFIGGFNSVLPYLLYISLIWAFMIIGLSGKLSFLKPGKAFQIENNASVGISGNAVHSLNQITDSQDTETTIPTVENHFPDPVTVIYPIAAGVKPKICRYLHSFSLRGPPSFT